MNVAYKNFSNMDSEPDRMYQAWNISPCPDRNCNHCVITAYHTVWNVTFLFLERQEKNNCAFVYTVTLIV